MKKILLLLVAAVVVIGVAGSAAKDGTNGPGSPAAYAKIASQTSCTALQATFDRGESTSKRSGYVPDGPAFEGASGARWSAVGLGYMEAADRRMRQIGCY